MVFGLRSTTVAHLAAALAIASLAFSPAALAQSEKDANSELLQLTGDLSQQCSQAISQLYEDPDFMPILKNTSSILVRYIGDRQADCIAPAMNCASPLSWKQWCCGFDLLDFWTKDNADVLETMDNAGRRVGPGEVQFLSQSITLHWQNPPGYTTMSLSFAQPWYAPEPCRNTADALAIGQAASSACASGAWCDVPYADTKLCTLSF